MDQEFLKYLLDDLKDHLEQLKESAFTGDPDGDRVEYHFDKASSIIGRLVLCNLCIQHPGAAAADPGSSRINLYTK